MIALITFVQLLEIGRMIPMLLEHLNSANGYGKGTENVPEKEREKHAQTERERDRNRQIEKRNVDSYRN